VLRERFDEDWYRNPRVADVLQGAAARGPTLSVVAFTKELGVPEGVSTARALELFD
jgi:hypothetical protein